MRDNRTLTGARRRSVGSRARPETTAAEGELTSDLRTVMKSHLALQNPPPPPPSVLINVAAPETTRRRLGVGSHQETREDSRYSELVPQKRRGGGAGAVNLSLPPPSRQRVRVACELFSASFSDPSGFNDSLWPFLSETFRLTMYEMTSRVSRSPPRIPGTFTDPESVRWIRPRRRQQKSGRSSRRRAFECSEGGRTCAPATRRAL